MAQFLHFPILHVRNHKIPCKPYYVDQTTHTLSWAWERKENPSLPEPYLSWTSNFHYKIDAAHLDELIRLTAQAKHEWEWAPEHPMAITRARLTLAETAVNQVFAILSDCIFDLKTNKYYRGLDRALAHPALLYRFWHRQADHKDLMRLCKAESLLHRKTGSVGIGKLSTDLIEQFVECLQLHGHVDTAIMEKATAEAIHLSDLAGSITPMYPRTPIESSDENPPGNTAPQFSHGQMHMLKNGMLDTTADRIRAVTATEEPPHQVVTKVSKHKEPELYLNYRVDGDVGLRPYSIIRNKLTLTESDPTRLPTRGGIFARQLERVSDSTSQTFAEELSELVSLTDSTGLRIIDLRPDLADPVDFNTIQDPTSAVDNIFNHDTPSPEAPVPENIWEVPPIPNLSKDFVGVIYTDRKAHMVDAHFDGKTLTFGNFTDIDNARAFQPHIEKKAFFSVQGYGTMSVEKDPWGIKKALKGYNLLRSYSLSSGFPDVSCTEYAWMKDEDINLDGIYLQQKSTTGIESGKGLALKAMDLVIQQFRSYLNLVCAPTEIAHSIRRSDCSHD